MASGAAPLYLGLLGGFRAERSGEAIPDSAWRRRSALTLVKLLAATSGHRLHREQVSELLWPEAGSELAADHLHKALYAARHALEPDLPPKQPSSYLRLTGAEVGLLCDAMVVDADEFEAAAGRALSAGDAASVEAALALYTGELLPEDRYEDWPAARRDELAGLHLRLLIHLAGLFEREGKFAEAIEPLRQALALDPTREEVHRSVMRLMALAGSRHQALRQYQECIRVLRDEVDAEPELETQSLSREIAAGRLDAAFSVAAPALPGMVARLPSGSLIGRERAQALLSSQMAQAREGSGGMVLISGEAGIGKSRLMAELARAEHRQGALVLWGAGYLEEGLLPYGPFVQALDGYLSRRPAEERRALAERFPEVVPLLASLEPRDRRALARSDGQRTRLFTAVTRLLGEITGERPLLLALDDLHVADEASVQLLHHLALAAGTRPWLLLAAYRVEEATGDSAVRRMAVTAARQQISRQVELLRLSQDQTGLLARSLLENVAPEPEVLDRVFRLSLGNPLFASELARSLTATPAHAGEAATLPDAVPGGIRDLVEARAARLSAAARATASLAAVAGASASFAVLQGAGALQETALLDALEELLAARVLTEQGGGYHFVHPLFQQVLQEALSRSRRRVLHGKVAVALEVVNPSDVEGLAYHYGRSSHQEKALLYLERAGDRARTAWANVVAESSYREVLRRLRENGRDEDIPRVEDKLGRSLFVLARHDEALELLERAAMDYQRREDHEREAAAVAEIGRLHRERGTVADGIARVELTRERLNGRPLSGSAKAALLVSLAHLYFAVARYQEQLEAATQASALAREAGDTWLLAEAEMRRGHAPLMMLHVSDPRYLEARQVLLRAVPLAEESGNLDALQRCLTNIGVSFEGAGELEEAIGYRERALAVVERMGNPTLIASCLGNLANVLFWVGRWDTALELLRRSLKTLDTVSFSWYEPFPRSQLAQLLLHRGQLPEARLQADRALESAEEIDDPFAIHLALRVVGEIDVVEGRAEEARGRIGRFLERGDISSGFRAWVHPPLIEALMQLGLLDEAEALALWTAERQGSHAISQAEVMRIVGMLRLHRNHPEEAATAFQESLGISRRLPYPLAEARTLAEQSVLHERIGDTTAARRDLEAALAIFRRLGAELYIDRAESALAPLLA